METTATLAPVARPCSAADSFPSGEEGGRAVVAEAVGLAFAIRDGGAAALRAHEVDVVAALLAL